MESLNVKATAEMVAGAKAVSGLAGPKAALAKRREDQERLIDKDEAELERLVLETKVDHTDPKAIQKAREAVRKQQRKLEQGRELLDAIIESQANLNVKASKASQGVEAIVHRAFKSAASVALPNIEKRVKSAIRDYAMCRLAANPHEGFGGIQLELEILAGDTSFLKEVTQGVNEAKRNLRDEITKKAGL